MTGSPADRFTTGSRWYDHGDRLWVVADAKRDGLVLVMVDPFNPYNPLVVPVWQRAAWDSECHESWHFRPAVAFTGAGARNVDGEQTAELPAPATWAAVDNQVAHRGQRGQLPGAAPLSTRAAGLFVRDWRDAS